MERKEKREKKASPSTKSTAWPHFEFSSSVSARKLGASLWELQPHYPLPNMHKGSSNLCLQHFKDGGFDDVIVHNPLHQVAPCNPAITPYSSLGLKERNRGSGYRVKPATELLKVLNRICALEERHVSNMSLVKSLKTELDLSRKLRKHSESLQRKLARRLSEVNSCFADALKELERERKARTLLENLCDEFARVQCIKHKQTKPAKHNTINVDKLSLDIQAFSAPQGAVDEEDSCDPSDKPVKLRPQNSCNGCKLHRSRWRFDDKVRNESRFREDSRVIQSVYEGRASSKVQQWISKLKSPDFEKSDPSMKSRNEYIEGKITRSKTRRPAMV